MKSISEIYTPKKMKIRHGQNTRTKFLTVTGLIGPIQSMQICISIHWVTHV